MSGVFGSDPAGNRAQYAQRPCLSVPPSLLASLVVVGPRLGQSRRLLVPDLAAAIENSDSPLNPFLPQRFIRLRNIQRMMFPIRRQPFSLDDSHVEIVPDDTAVQRVFSGISHFPRPFIQALLHTCLSSPASALKASVLGAAQISPLKNTKIVRTFTNNIFWQAGAVWTNVYCMLSCDAADWARQSHKCTADREGSDGAEVVVDSRRHRNNLPGYKINSFEVISVKLTFEDTGAINLDPKSSFQITGLSIGACSCEHADVKGYALTISSHVPIFSTACQNIRGSLAREGPPMVVVELRASSVFPLCVAPGRAIKLQCSRCDYLPLILANRVRFPARVAPRFSHMVGGFSRDLPFPLPLHYGATPCPPHLALIGSEDLDVESRPNISTRTLSKQGRIQKSRRIDKERRI
ncbi:hypothetical protein PR048_014789 [Dryococelus australis]|uniref:Uncharacterized protein n=1 Tax=Dryococelus australis TaxID=614101 RepID=A0ABQ9HFA5_9NEOP|nr:hypothetical protein PR048_014789 [Dryococelus australis]